VLPSRRQLNLDVRHPLTRTADPARKKILYEKTGKNMEKYGKKRLTKIKFGLIINFK
jgi:hypothetical protein